MRKAVITGYGIVSSIGIGKDAVLESLKVGRSGIVAEPDFIEKGMRKII